MRNLSLLFLVCACATHSKVQTDFDYYSGKQQTWYRCKNSGTARLCYKVPQGEDIDFAEKALIPMGKFEQLLNNQL